MKRIYISILFLIAVLCIASAEIGYVSAKSDGIISMIEQTDRYMLKSNFEDAIEHCKKTEVEWNESVSLIDMLLIHDYVDGIGTNIAKMQSYIENGNPDMYFAESASTKKELASIKESEYPNFSNIF